MSENSKIEWTDNTFNPWEGCVKISPACDNCYAAARDNRLHQGANWGKDAARFPHTDSYWRQPLKWNRDAEASGKRARVFCGSLCDVMEDRPDLQRYRERLYLLIERTPNLDWLLLTKRPQNFRRFLPESWLETPLPNVWGMTTVESNTYHWRIDALIATPFAIRGLSCEPLLENLRIEKQLGTGLINWVIAGGESGRSARPSHPDWIRSLRNQCQAAGVSFFFKQWGEYLPAGQDGSLDSAGRKVLNCSDIAMRVGKKIAGAFLDGREWKEFPA